MGSINDAIVQYMINNAATLQTRVFIPLSDGYKASTAFDYISGTSGSVYHGSPDLTVLSHDGNDDTITCMRASGSVNYVSIDTSQIVSRLDGKWSMNFWVRWWGTPDDTSVGSFHLNGGDDGTGTFDSFFAQNTIAISLRASKDGVADTNKISFDWAGPHYSSRKGINFQTSQAQFDGQWHQITITHATDDGGTINLYFDGSVATATGMDGTGASIPQTLEFALGSYTSNGSVYSSNYGNNVFEYANFSFHIAALTIDDIFGLADAYNKNLGLKSENRDVLSEVVSKYQSQIVTFFGCGDSNQTKPPEHGYIYTDVAEFLGINNTKIAGYWLGCNGPGFGTQWFNGIWNNNIGNYASNVPTFINDWNMARWNDTNSTFSPSGTTYGYSQDTKWVSGNMTISEGNTRTILEPTSIYWPFESNANLKTTYYYATFDNSYTGSGVMYPCLKDNFGHPAIVGGTPVYTKTGTNGFATGSLLFGNLTGSYYEYSLSLSTSPAIGPVSLSYTHFDDINKNTGLDYACFFAHGGNGYYTMAASLANTGVLPLSKLTNFFTAFGQPAISRGQSPFCILKLTFGQNDKNFSQISYTYSGGIFDTGNIYKSRTEIGMRNNARTIIDRLTDAWVAAGFDSNNFKIQFGPYHSYAASPGDWFQQQRATRAERYLIEEVYPTRAYRFSGFDLVTSAQMYASGGYLANNTDYAHLNITGYTLMAVATASEFATYVNSLSNLDSSSALSALDCLHKLYFLGY